MRIVTNKTIVRNRARTVWSLGLGGILMMLAGGYYLFSGYKPVVVVPILLGGFIIGNIGTLLGRRWLRKPRPEVALKSGMKDLSDRYVLYNYVLPVPHVVLAPHALFAVRAVRQYGEISCEGSRWKHHRPWQRSLLEMDVDRLGNPFRGLKQDMSKMRGFLREHFPDEEVPVSGAVAFISPDVEVTATDPLFPVAEVSEFGNALQSAQKGESRLSRRQRQELETLFDSLV